MNKNKTMASPQSIVRNLILEDALAKGQQQFVMHGKTAVAEH